MFKLLFSRKQTLLIVCPLVLFSCTNQANRALFIDEQYSHAVDAVKHLDKKDIKDLVVLKQSDPLSGVTGVRRPNSNTLSNLALSSDDIKPSDVDVAFFIDFGNLSSSKCFLYAILIPPLLYILRVC